jgi:thiol-disulfide isomerase/thioredoxin
MSARLAPILGVLAGVLVAALAMGAFVAFGPEPVPSPTPLQTGFPSPSASASVPTSPSASTGQSAEPSASESGQPAPSGSASASASLAGVFHIGEAAPALDVPGLEGGAIDLTQLRGKPVWVNFMATWCPSCRDELPLMNGYSARYSGDGLVVLAVDVQEAPDLVKPYMTSLSVLFPVGLDSDGAAARRWGALALPVHFWIDAQGIVRHGALGGIGPDEMAIGLQSILPGVTIQP